MNLKPIIQGYSNALFRDDLQVEAEAARRLQICNNCPLQKIIMGVKCCGVCCCPLAGLTRQNTKVCKKWKI
ncbi:hypothetical protein [Capnocytophaga sp. oral taxon 878]|uniref:hypothetical protein n=1 Tax=Capnocytophaga sp. oral taxon 878 TaxID=1316596 RepID=UPI0013EDDF23|nr:hypothetical protein [Capnocytophaga sp. oral taxon 878]